MQVGRGRRTTNRVLQDMSIRHAIYLQRLKSGEAQRVLALLSRDVYSHVRKAIRERVAAMQRLGSDTGPVTTERLYAIEQSIQSVQDALDGARAALEGRLTDIGAAEAAWQVRAINHASPFAFDLVAPSPVQLRSLVTSRPMQGHLLRDWWSGVGTDLRGGIMRDLRVGVAAGQTNDQIVRALLDTTRGPLALSRRNAEAIVRTSVAHVSTHARHTTFEENSDVVGKWQWVATLDHRTCPVCGKLDGQTFDLGDGPVDEDGHQLRGGDAHFSCRCTPSPVTKSFAELGIDLKEMPPGTRASLDGQVPGAVTYRDWIADQSAEFQDDVLGPTRGRLLRAGKVSFDSFVDDRGRTLTLEEIRVIEGLDRDDVAVRRGG